MLETLRICNYALIDNLELEFGPGFTVLTGETGAGKSIIVGALMLILGGRASSDAVRKGAERAEIEAVFRFSDIPPRLSALLEENDIALDDGALILARRISRDGRSKAYAGGGLVPASILAALGDELVDLHGQHEHQSLLHAERQLELLDAFSGTEAAASGMAKRVAELRDIERRMADLEQTDRERVRRMEFLRHEVNEIDQAHLEPGEEENLDTRRRQLANAESIIETAAQAYQALYEREGASAIEGVDSALRQIEALADVDPELAALAEQLQDIHARIADVAGEVRQVGERMETDPEELERLNGRWNVISGLKRKYGDTISAILAYRDEAAEELAQYEQRDERLAQLREEHEAKRTEAMAAARDLSSKRRAGAKKLDRKVTKTLRDLDMPDARFETRFEETGLTPRGIDRIGFVLAANKGESLKPLRQVASGGEVSRIMLALKTVFAAGDRIPTLIFDEIDAGVGGTAANKVAARLQTLADSHQTLCITHLPQIAAAANGHFHVSKSTQRGRAVTAVRNIQDEDRVEEVARLLDGALSPVSIEHARSLLNAS